MQDVELWASEWIEKAYAQAPKFGEDVQTRTYEINWRFVTNAGQDDGIIRPVLGAYGWPYYPGSSMKGIFRSACTPEQRERYCGIEIKNGDCKPGILRFHGGYPTSEEWQENLVDIVHPQQSWQVGMNENTAAAFALISLYQPELVFGISANQPVDWDEVWQIWEKALAKGIGCRVSSGYGQSAKTQGKVLYSTTLKGQGMAPKLLNREGEFRPNVFRAAIRGHALRIFGGLTNGKKAIELVETLFGGVQGQGGTVGLLAMSFEEKSLKDGEFGRGAYAVPTYDVEGTLYWILTQEISDSQKEALTKLIKVLTRFAMVFGGFGKSWRRADHRLFYPEYNEDSRKPLIGCHWEWSGDKSFKFDVRVRKLAQVAEFIKQVQEVAKEWMKIQGVAPTPNNYANDWREAWHPEKVQVWGREADRAENSIVIEWLHKPYRRGDRQLRIQEGSIYKTHLTGKVSQVGRIWHRMYPLVILAKNPDNPKKPIPKKTPRYLEFLIFFPDKSSESGDFQNFLDSEQNYFQQLWP